jgi:hypothetical protein
LGRRRRRVGLRKVGRGNEAPHARRVGAPVAISGRADADVAVGERDARCEPKAEEKNNAARSHANPIE